MEQRRVENADGDDGMATFAEERAHAKTTGNVGRGREENVREREEEREDRKEGER